MISSQSLRKSSDVLYLRQKVFIIEQDCFYEDLDYSDQDANHLLLYKDDKLVGYSRVFPPGIKYNTASIGRIVTDQEYRGWVLEKALHTNLFNLERIISESDITTSPNIGSLIYTDLGFEKEGSVYLEDDIDHIKMI